MGRPKELSEADRAKLIANGLHPYEVWLPDVNSPTFWQELEREGAAIREAEKREGTGKVLDAFAKDNWDDLD